MKAATQRYPLYAFLFILMLTMTSCDAIGSIFKAGAWTGAVAVILVIGVVIWLFAKMLGGGGGGSR